MSIDERASKAPRLDPVCEVEALRERVRTLQLENEQLKEAAAAAGRVKETTGLEVVQALTPRVACFETARRGRLRGLRRRLRRLPEIQIFAQVPRSPLRYAFSIPRRTSQNLYNFLDSYIFYFSLSEEKIKSKRRDLHRPAPPPAPLRGPPVWR